MREYIVHFIIFGFLMFWFGFLLCSILTSGKIADIRNNSTRKLPIDGKRPESNIPNKFRGIEVEDEDLSYYKEVDK